ncbi:FmdB family zinc ribbon protein [Pseudoclavibacter endophyticus]|uniref:FmdB family zinc ribbon protein n=1 Tax=Pseudoclavibacter endophyticus TaxID=1778590 RepID=UPI001CE3E15B|nr:FmdB family zinc ribbon protein [Pseudoclavibacter endophyticus]
MHQSFSDASLTLCPECGGQLRKLFGAVGIAFKGSGFYRNDHGAGAKKPASSTTESGANETGSSSDAAAPSAPASTPPVSTPPAPAAAGGASTSATA